MSRSKHSKSRIRNRKTRPYGFEQYVGGPGAPRCPCCCPDIESFRGAERARVRVETQAMSTLTTTDYGRHAFGHLDCTKRELAQFNFDTPWIPDICDCGDPEHDDPRHCILAEDEYNWFDEYLSCQGDVTE
jgi:hypothetical protein